MRIEIADLENLEDTAQSISHLATALNEATRQGVSLHIPDDFARDIHTMANALSDIPARLK